MYILTSKTLFSFSVWSFCHFRGNFANRRPSVTDILNCQSGQAQGATFLPVFRAFNQLKGILVQSSHEKEVRNVVTYRVLNRFDLILGEFILKLYSA